jgi:drug/metabolite transporter (DMT)-like permease
MGSLGLFVRQISASDEAIALTRFSLGAAFLLAFLLVTRNLTTLRVTFSIPLILGGAFLALAVLFYIRAILHIALAEAAFLLYLGPLFATALAAIFLRERLTRLNVVLLFLAVLGCLFILDMDMTVGRSLGELYGVLSALFYAAFIVANRLIPAEMEVAGRTFYQLIFGTLFLLPFLRLSDVSIHLGDALWLLAIGLIHGFGAITLLIVAVQHLPAYQYATLSYVEPLAAAVIGAVVYGEVLAPLQIAGCALVLIGGLAQARGSR